MAARDFGQQLGSDVRMQIALPKEGADLELFYFISRERLESLLALELRLLLPKRDLPGVIPDFFGLAAAGFFPAPFLSSSARFAFSSRARLTISGVSSPPQPAIINRQGMTAATK